ncbi:MAG: dehydrogenase [Gammaproteobacteria bacterium]|nr:dehydrogenase [Gammaproteobacteria bacterium]
MGQHLTAMLTSKGHAVVCAVRRSESRDHLHCEALIEADFTRDTHVAAWVPRLQGIEAVINAVGILREHGSQTFAAVHVQAPCALFDACVIAGVNRVINISALGADAAARSGYHVSKRRADRHLAGLPLSWTIVQPSLVYGPGGDSARLFTMLASLPWIPLPGCGTQQVQPIHIDDLTAGVAALLTSDALVRSTVPFVGACAITLRDFLTQLRAGMDLPPRRFLLIPLWLVRTVARLGQHVPRSLLDVETLDMLLRGNVGDPRAVESLLGRRVRRPDQFITAAEAPWLRTAAQLSWLLPLLRWSVALVWILTGIVSLGLFPIASSYELLFRVGVPSALAPLFLYGAAAVDLALGVATLLMRHRRALWLAQAALILFYTIVISLRMPEFWLHPYGPLLKNVPLLAAIAMLYVLERR